MMTRIIEIKDDKAMKLLKSLESIDFITFKDVSVTDDKMKYLLELKPKNISKEDDFSDLKGLWKNRVVTLKQIRDKAWPQRK